MSELRDELIDEAVLRRALRLEPDERIARFDAHAIALMAPSTLPLRAAVGALVGAAVIGLLAIGAWSLIFAFSPALFDAAMTAALDLTIAIATVLQSAADIATQPAVPLSLLAATGVAILHELRERREQTHANAS